MVPTSLFDGIDYTALGHLHGRASAHRLGALQRLARWPTRSPRRPTSRARWLVDLDADGSVTAEFVEAPVPRAAGRCSRAPSTSCWPTRPTPAPRRPGCRRPSPTRPGPTAAMERLRARFPHAVGAAVRARRAAGASPERVPTVGRSAHDIALDFVDHVRGGPATAAGVRPAARGAGVLPRRPRPRRDLPDRPGGRREVGPMRLHQPVGDRVRAVRRHRVRRLRRAVRGRALPAHRRHRRRQDQRPRRRLLRALRRGARRPAHRPPPAQRPRRPERRAAGRARADRRPSAPSGSPGHPRGSGPRSAARAPPGCRPTSWSRSCATAAWTTLTNRLDEAGQLVTHLLGMTCAQFTQVAMLPQNRFQAFLRASSADRQAVLQRLFRTERFEAVERWLVDRRLGAAAARARPATTRWPRCSTASRRPPASAVPEEWDAARPRRPGRRRVTARLGDRQHEAAAAAAARQRGALAAADESLADAQQRLADGARRRRPASARHRGARRPCASWPRPRPTRTSSTERLDGHRRALPGPAPRTPRRRRHHGARRGRGGRAQAHVADVAERLGVDGRAASTPTAVDEALTRASETRAVAESWLPREQELATERARVESLADEVERLSTHPRRSTRTQLAELAPRRAGADPSRPPPQARVAATLADRRERVEQVERAAHAAPRVPGARPSARGAAQPSWPRPSPGCRTCARSTSTSARPASRGWPPSWPSAWPSAVSCPVCGSAEHPSPATSAARITRDDEEAGAPAPRDRRLRAAGAAGVRRHPRGPAPRRARPQRGQPADLLAAPARSRRAPPPRPPRGPASGRPRSARSWPRSRPARRRPPRVSPRRRSRSPSAPLPSSTRWCGATPSRPSSQSLPARPRAGVRGRPRGPPHRDGRHAHRRPAPPCCGWRRPGPTGPRPWPRRWPRPQDAGFPSARQALAAHLADEVCARLEADLEQRRTARTAAAAVLADPAGPGRPRHPARRPRPAGRRSWRPTDAHRDQAARRAPARGDARPAARRPARRAHRRAARLGAGAARPRGRSRAVRAGRGQERRQRLADAALGLRPVRAAAPGRRGRQRATGRR